MKWAAKIGEWNGNDNQSHIEKRCGEDGGTYQKR